MSLFLQIVPWAGRRLSRFTDKYTKRYLSPNSLLHSFKAQLKIPCSYFPEMSHLSDSALTHTTEIDLSPIL